MPREKELSCLGGPGTEVPKHEGQVEPCRNQLVFLSKLFKTDTAPSSLRHDTQRVSWQHAPSGNLCLGRGSGLRAGFISHILQCSDKGLVGGVLLRGARPCCLLQHTRRAVLLLDSTQPTGSCHLKNGCISLPSPLHPSLPLPLPPLPSPDTHTYTHNMAFLLAEPYCLLERALKQKTNVESDRQHKRLSN